MKALVLHFTIWKRNGGGSFVAEYLSNSLPNSQIVYLESDPNCIRPFGNNDEHHIYQFNFKSIHKLIAKLSAFDQIIIHTHGRRAGTVVRLLLFFMPKSRITLVHTFHGLFSLRKFDLILALLIEKILSTITSYYVCVSQSELKLAQKYIGNNSKYAMIPLYSRIPCKNNSNFLDSSPKANKYTFGMISRFVKGKRQDLVLETISKIDHILSSLDISLEFLFVGDGPFKMHLQNKSKKINFTNVSLCFLNETTDIIKIFDNIDCLVHATDFEGCPLIVLESYSRNVPVICSNVRGCNDIVIDGKTGLLFDNNVIDLSAKLLLFLMAPTLQYNIIHNARHALSDYSQKKFIDKHLILYANLQ